MKRLLTTLLILGLVLCPVLSFAVGTTTVVNPPKKVKVLDTEKRVVTVTIVADASTGAIANGTINSSTLGIEGWHLYAVETVPGTTNPTTLYDLVINDANGFALTGTDLSNRSASAPEKVVIDGAPMIFGNWTLVGTNNSVHSATITVYLEFLPQ